MFSCVAFCVARMFMRVCVCVCVCVYVLCLCVCGGCMCLQFKSLVGYHVGPCAGGAIYDV